MSNLQQFQCWVGKSGMTWHLSTECHALARSTPLGYTVNADPDTTDTVRITRLDYHGVEITVDLSPCSFCVRRRVCTICGIRFGERGAYAGMRPSDCCGAETCRVEIKRREQAEAQARTEAAEVVRREWEQFKGCVTTATGRKYHRRGCASFWRYAPIYALDSLRVERENRQTGEPEWVTLTPCKVCDPPILDDREARLAEAETHEDADLAAVREVNLTAQAHV